jgi:tyrosine-protein phosphatase YwqE
VVDIQPHILPGLDDGSPALDISLKMAIIARDAGTTDIVATPRADSSYRFEPLVIGERLAELQKAWETASPSTAVATSAYPLRKEPAWEFWSGRRALVRGNAE